MINVIVPIENNAKHYRKILSDLSGNDEITVYVGVVQNQLQYIQDLESENINMIEYLDGAKREEIINALSKFIPAGELVIMRRPITSVELERFLNSKSDITVCKNKISGFKKVFVMLWQKLLKMCLGIKLYAGDTSVIDFKEDVSPVVLQSSNLSYSTRVDRWRGLTQGSVEVSGNPVKTSIDKKTNIKYLLFAILALVVGVAVTTLVSLFVKVSIVIGLLLFCLDVIMFAIFLLLIIVIMFNCIVGQKHFSMATECVPEDDEELYQFDELSDEDEEEYDDEDFDNELDDEGNDEDV